MKSSRHIFKLPFDIPIRFFEVKNPIHQKLVELGEKGQEVAKQSIEMLIESNKEQSTKLKIQNMLNEKLKPVINQIDELLIRDLS
jgi:hypothetical protein